MSTEMGIGSLFVELLVKDEKWGPAIRKAMDDVDTFRVKGQEAGRAVAAASAPIATAFAQVSEAEKKAISTLVAHDAAEKARAKTLGVSVSQLRELDRALKSTAAAGKSAAQAAGTQAVPAVQQLGKASGAAAAQAQNLRFQLFDVVQQLASGQNPMMIANQQGFQIAQAFSGGASAAEVLAVALGPVAAVLGTIAVVAGTAYLAYQSLTEEQERNAASAKVVAESQAKLKPIFDAQWEAMIDLRVATGEMTEAQAKEARARRAAHRTVQDALADTTARMRALRSESAGFGGFVGDMEEAVSDFVGFQNPIAMAIDDMTTSSGEADVAIGKLADSQVQMALAAKTGIETQVAATEIADRLTEKTKNLDDTVKKLTASAAKNVEALRDMAAGATASARHLAELSDAVGADEALSEHARLVAEATRSRAEAMDKAEDAWDDAMAAAARIGGETGAQIEAAARQAFTAAGIAAEDEYLARVELADRKAAASASEAAAKRIDAARDSAARSGDAEEQYARKVTALAEELLAVEVDYAHATADERLAVTRAILGEIEALEAEHAEKLADEHEKAAKAAMAAWSDVVSRATATVDAALDATLSEADKVQAALDADAAAREKIADGEVLTAEENAALMSGLQKQAAEEQVTTARETAMALFAIQKAAALVSIAIDTAKAAMAAIAAIPPPGGEVAAGIIIGLGAVQAGIVAAQELEFHSGGEVTAAARRAVSSAGLDPDEVRAVLQVGEGVLTRDAVQGIGGAPVLDAINAEPSRALAALSSMSPTRGLSPSPVPARPSRPQSSAPPPFAPPGSATSGTGSDRPIVVVTRVDGRTFDTMMAQGLDGQRLPRLRRSLRQMSGVTAGLET